LNCRIFGTIWITAIASRLRKSHWRFMPFSLKWTFCPRSATAIYSALWPWFYHPNIRWKLRHSTIEASVLVFLVWDLRSDSLFVGTALLDGFKFIMIQKYLTF